MSLNIILVITFLIISIIFIYCWYLAYYKRIDFDKKCTCKTKGTVVGYVLQGGGDEIKFDIPQFEYKINNKKYYVNGPSFKCTVYKHYKWNENCNISDIHNLPDKLKINVKGSFFHSKFGNPFKELYPIGTSCDIYYNPDKPNEAFVERWVNPSKMWYLFIVFSVICLIFSIIFGTSMLLN